jgi:hypothetical protein
MKQFLKKIKSISPKNFTPFEVVIVFSGCFFILATVLDKSAQREIAFVAGLFLYKILSILLEKYNKG